jgi:hypothetical protein
MGLLLLIVLIVFLLGGLPNLGLHSYGYAPSGLVGVRRLEAAMTARATPGVRAVEDDLRLVTAKN